MTTLTLRNPETGQTFECRPGTEVVAGSLTFTLAAAPIWTGLAPGNILSLEAPVERISTEAPTERSAYGSAEIVGDLEELRAACVPHGRVERAQFLIKKIIDRINAGQRSGQ